MPSLIGTAANQVPVNGMLGTAAFVDLTTLSTPSTTQVLTNKTISAATNIVEAVGIKSATTVVSVSASAAPTSGQVLTATGASTATWQSPSSGSFVLLATLTPTVAVNVDFLNVFNSTYDNYLILGDGITFAADEGLNVQAAVAGAAVGTNHFLMLTSSTESSANSNSFQLPSSATIRSAGKGANFALTVCNVNDATRAKMFGWQIAWQSATGTEGHTQTTAAGVFSSASAVTGLRFRSTFGGNFAATGKIRVYGYANA